MLLSKRYQRSLPNIPGRTYVQPSAPIRMDKFDYANPDGLQEVFDLGTADGHAFASKTQAATQAASDSKAAS